MYLVVQSEGPDGDDDDRNGWVFVKATRTGQRGYVPTDYIEPTQSPPVLKSPVVKEPHQASNNNIPTFKIDTPPQSRADQTTPNHIEFSDRMQSESPSHNQTPEVGMRLSMAALVNPPPPLAEPQTQPHVLSEPPLEQNSSTPIGETTSTFPPAPPILDTNRSDEPKQYGMDKKPFGMDVADTPFPSPGKKSKGPGSSIASFSKSAGASKGGSASKSKLSSMSKFKKAGNMVQNMVRVSSAVAAPRVPSLASAVEREDWNELTKRNDEYFGRLVSSQAETFDSLTDMVDALSKKLNEATKSSHDLVSKLSELDELIDEEKRKWKSQNETEKNAEVLGRSKQLISNTGKEGSTPTTRGQ